MEPFLDSLPSDIFSGQIIASLIVLAFLAIFLLREWIQQNARPGIFDDVQPDPVPQLEDLPALAPAAPEPGPAQVADPPVPVAHERDVGNAHPRVDPAMETDEDDIPPRPLRDVSEDVRATDPSSSSSSDTERPARGYHTIDSPRKEADRLRRAKAGAIINARRYPKPTRRREREDEDEYEVKRRQKRRFESFEAPVLPIASSSNLATSLPKKIHLSEAPPTPGNSNDDIVIPASKGKGKAVDVGEIVDDTRSASDATERESFSPSSDFEFTFSAPQRAFPAESVNSRTSSPEVGSLLDSEVTPSGSVYFGSKILRPSFDYPLPDQTKRNTSSPSSPLTDSPLNDDPSASSSPAQTLRRPPLASTSFSLPDTFDGDGSISKPPSLVSPGLVTYRPPEDLRDDDDADYFIHSAEANTSHHSELADADDEDEIEEARSIDELTNKHDEGPRLLPDTDEEDEEEPRNDQRELAIQVEFRQPLNPPVREGAAQPAEADEEDREQNFDEDLDGALEGMITTEEASGALMYICYSGWITWSCCGRVPERMTARLFCVTLLNHLF